MELALVRHACAGRKRDWSGSDAMRPLDAVGLKQADALVRLFDGRPISRLLASPAHRCAQTLGPLAAGRDLVVGRSKRLGPGASSKDLLALLTSPDNGNAVLCTHGEAMARLLPVLGELGAAPGPGNRQHVLEKGSVWLVRVEDGPRRAIASVDHHLPLGPGRCEVDAFEIDRLEGGRRRRA